MRQEAGTVEHLLTHLPNTPFCEACVRGNMTRKRARTRKPADNAAIPTTFGEQVAADHLVTNRLVSTDWHTRKYVVGVGTCRLVSHRREKGHRGPPGPTGPYLPTPISDAVLMRWI